MDVGAWEISPENLSYIPSKYIHVSFNQKIQFYHEMSGIRKFCLVTQ